MRLRWGILGTGNIAKQFAGGVRQSETGTLAAVASRSAEAADAFAKRFGVDCSYGDYAAMLADAQLDAVYVSLPNTMHHEWTIKALHAGKHVLCEKPIAVSVAEVEEMFAVARRHGRVLVEAFMYRCHPQTHKVLELIRGGAIGRVRTIRTSFCFRVRKTEGNIRFDPALAGGALWDVGCYCVDFSRLVANAAVTDCGAIAVRHASGVDERVSGAIAFEGGIHAGFVCGMDVQADNSAYVCGDEGYLRIPVPWKPPPGEGQIIIARGTPPKQDGPVTQPPPPEVHHITDARALYGIEADAFAAVIAGTAPPFVPPEDSIANIRLIERLRAGLF